MRIGIISDIHSNLVALEAALARLGELKADIIYCLGDTVGYGPSPNECLAIVRERCAVVLKGNHDSGLVGETPLSDFNKYGLKAIQWSQKVITKENLEYLKSLPFTTIQNGITLAHASPHQPEEWTYVLTLRAAKDGFTAFSTNVCFIGHTHVPVIIGEDGSINRYKNGDRFLINVGSIGQPRDGNPKSAFGLLDTETGSYELIRVEYDAEKVAKAIDDAGLPDFLGKRLLQGI